MMSIKKKIGMVKELTMHLDDRGFLFEALRADDDIFTKFGQAYVSSIYPGVVKGFHKHFIQADHVVCVGGQIRLVLVDDSGSEPIIEEHHLSLLNPKLIVIPPGIYHGWACIGNSAALVMNVSSEPFDRNNPDEFKIDPHSNPWGYTWKTVDK